MTIQPFDYSGITRETPGNGLDWCLAFFGTQMAGAIAVPVNTRFSDSEVEYLITDSGSRFAFLPGAPLPDGEPFAGEPSLLSQKSQPGTCIALIPTP